MQLPAPRHDGQGARDASPPGGSRCRCRTAPGCCACAQRRCADRAPHPAELALHRNRPRRRQATRGGPQGGSRQALAPGHRRLPAGRRLRREGPRPAAGALPRRPRRAGAHPAGRCSRARAAASCRARALSAGPRRRGQGAGHPRRRRQGCRAPRRRGQALSRHLVGRRRPGCAGGHCPRPRRPRGRAGRLAAAAPRLSRPHGVYPLDPRAHVVVLPGARPRPRGPRHRPRPARPPPPPHSAAGQQAHAPRRVPQTSCRRRRRAAARRLAAAGRRREPRAPAARHPGGR